MQSPCVFEESSFLSLLCYLFIGYQCFQQIVHSRLLKVQSPTHVRTSSTPSFILLGKSTLWKVRKRQSLAKRPDRLKVNFKLLVIHDLVGLRVEIARFQRVPVSTKWLLISCQVGGVGWVGDGGVGNSKQLPQLDLSFPVGLLFPSAHPPAKTPTFTQVSALPGV